MHVSYAYTFLRLMMLTRSAVLVEGARKNATRPSQRAKIVSKADLRAMGTAPRSQMSADLARSSATILNRNNTMTEALLKASLPARDASYFMREWSVVLPFREHCLLIS